MDNFTVELNKVTKFFGRLLVFKNIDYSFTAGKIYGITGRNGSGKSTVSKIICGLDSPSQGKINYSLNNENIERQNIFAYTGFLAPYLILYGEFSALENLEYFSKIRGINFEKEKALFWLNEFQIYKRRNYLLKTFSSGMLQRMKFIFALLHNPMLLVLDEPTSNLDTVGKDKVYEILGNLKEEKLIIIASNEKSDLELCSDFLNIEEYKKVE